MDLPALVRGRTEPGEVCEIPGVGPVPVAHAREVLSHGLLQLVITDGTDVQTVVSNTRHVPKALKIAIDERDQRCKVRGCDCTEHLERHHVDDYANSHDTSYKNVGKRLPAAPRPHHPQGLRSRHPRRRHLGSPRPTRRGGGLTHQAVNTLRSYAVLCSPVMSSWTATGKRFSKSITFAQRGVTEMRAIAGYIARD